jgi:folate-binding protein YgfZ
MALTPLLDALHAVGEGPLATAEYRGVETAARFSDRRQEFSALVKGCGVFDLGFRTRLSLKGGDRARWMNGMVTNNIRDLAAGCGIYAFLLNPQGRILGDMHVFNRGETLIVETDRTQLEKITATFDHYIIMDDVEVADIGAEQSAIGLSGPKSREILSAVGIKIPELQALQMVNPQCVCDCGCVECTLIRGEDAPHESYEIWLAPKDVLKTWKALVAAGATPIGSEALEMQRIMAGIPLYGVDIRERDLPQETGQERALNFSKGCYVGQEIVERIRSRGNVHRKFAGFVLQAGARIIAGDKIFSGEKEVGELTSIAAVPAESGELIVALGYIRREIGTPGREVQIGAEQATVAQLPLAALALAQSEDALLHNV